MKTNPCKYVINGERCGSTFHTAMYHKRSGLNQHKPMNRIGKVAKKTRAAVSKWERQQKTNHQGYYECFYCSSWIDYLVGEHTESKARHPESRTDINKLVITCNFDNERKGSMDAEEYIRKYYPHKLYLIDLLPK